MTDFLKPLVDAYVADAEAANKIATEVNGASEGSQAKTLKEWRETSDHADAVKYRENVEKAQAAILKWREAIDKTAAAELNFPEPISEEEKAKKKEEYKTHAAAAKKALNLLREVAETIKADLPEVPALLNFGSAKPAGERTGSTGTRTRWSKVEFSLDGGETETVKRLSDVVSSIKKVTGVVVSAGDLSKAVFEAAGTDDPEKITDASFEWSETGEDKVTHKWDVTVYRDPKKVEKDDKASDSE